MVEVSPLPQAPEIVLGVINLQGKIVVVLDVRRRFGLRAYEPSPDRQLMVAHTVRRTVSFPVDTVVGLIERSAGEITPLGSIVPGADCLEGVAKLEDGLLFIHDLDRFLSLDQEQQLADLLTEESGVAK
jgi:purine-binding chemotaxis protein CheW